jgi:hypothetical protein
MVSALACGLTLTPLAYWEGEQNYVFSEALARGKLHFDSDCCNGNV